MVWPATGDHARSGGLISCRSSSRSTGIAKAPGPSSAPSRRCRSAPRARPSRGRRRGADEAVRRVRRPADGNADDDDHVRCHLPEPRGLAPRVTSASSSTGPPTRWPGPAARAGRRASSTASRRSCPSGFTTSRSRRPTPRKFSGTADGGTVTITVPPPPPTPAPTPKPTPKPTRAHARADAGPYARRPPRRQRQSQRPSRPRSPSPTPAPPRRRRPTPAPTATPPGSGDG